MKWKAIRLLGAVDQFYMTKEDYDQKRGLLAKKSSNMFFEGFLYEVVKAIDRNKIQVKKSTAKINMLMIYAIEDSEYEIEVIE